MANQISPTEAARLLYGKGNALLPTVSLIDVRDADAFAREHLPGASHSDYQRQIDLLERITTAPPATKQLVFVCYAGVRSGRVAQIAASKGFTAVSIAGGVHAWHEAGLPIVRS
ncbi:MAG: rhodanese-like domain-containing protein [Candidatus Andersenbacteria bacterium]